VAVAGNPILQYLEAGLPQKKFSVSIDQLRVEEEFIKYVAEEP